MNNLGKALIIVNPVAQSGKGNKAGRSVYEKLKNKYKQDVEIKYTKHEGHGIDLAASSMNYDTVVIVGGDGLVHETATGLMRIQKKDRPKFALIPVGSGNDYSKSIAITAKVDKAINELMEAEVKSADIGKVNDQYFVETLSFGVDAGIALGTMDLRKKTGQKGLLLYFESGLNQIAHHFESYNFKAELDNGEVIENESYILAIQNGRSYGGGFPITPNAKLNDGILNICYTVGHMSRKKALAIFALASKGKHVNRKCIRFAQAKKLHLTIDRIVPCQIDGERYENTEFDIEAIPNALDVYVNKKSICF